MSEQEGFDWIITVGARIDLENCGPDEAQRRAELAVGVVKNALAALGLRPSARASVHPKVRSRAR